MTRIDILGPDEPLGEHLSRDLRGARGASIAVAFAKQSALSVLDLVPFCQGGGALRLLAGTDFFLTELALLNRLQPLPKADCRVYHQLDDRRRRTFHPKIYLIDRPDRRVAYIGSSNLTQGGLQGNIEANVRIEGPPDSEEIRRASTVFEQLFDSEFSAPLSPEFEARYQELQQEQREALRYTEPRRTKMDRLYAAEAMLLSSHRAQVRSRCWLLVVNPEHYGICMRERLWGREKESQIRSYAPGDLFFFHVNGRGICALGMFTGQPYWAPTSPWPRSDKGSSYNWCVRFQLLGELRTGVPTKQVVQPLYPGSPARWFNGWIQQSHGLKTPEFQALHRAFEGALREEIGMG